MSQTLVEAPKTWVAAEPPVAEVVPLQTLSWPLEPVNLGPTPDPGAFGKTRHESYRVPRTMAFAGTLFALLLTCGSQWPAFGAIEQGMFLLGLSLAIVGCLGRLWCGMYIAGYKTQSLVTCGPYSLCRNPLYFFSCVGSIGVLLASGTIGLPALVLFAFACYYPRIIRDEEARLMAIHQEKFTAYCRQTPSFFPSLKNFHEPLEYTVRPQVFRKGILDAFWFVFLAGGIHLFANLHRSGAIPTWYYLW